MPNHTESPAPGNKLAAAYSWPVKHYDYITLGAVKVATAKKCSISYVGDPGSIVLFLTKLPIQNLSEDYELLFTSKSLDMLDEPTRRFIEAKSRIIDLPSTSGLNQLMLETATHSTADFLVFVNNPVSLDIISAAIRTLEENYSNFAATSDKNIIAIRKIAIIGQQPGIADNKEKFWDTVETFNAGLGHVLQILDRTEMLRLMPQNGTVAEIGVFKGNFSSQIISVTKPSRLHLIDFWPDSMIQSDGERITGTDACKFVRNVFASEIQNNKVVLHKGLSSQVSQEFPDEYFDWIYIDADHNYAGVKSDLNCWYPKVKTGGFITGHDYIEKTWYGVVQAVNEFLKQKPLTFIALTAESHGSRSWVLKKLPAFPEIAHS
jgi:hypothetical protein